MLNKPTKRWHFDCEAVEDEYGYSCCDETIWADTKAALLKAASEAGWSYTEGTDTSLCSECNFYKTPVEGA